jgi:hypothetical protein
MKKEVLQAHLNDMRWVLESLPEQVNVLHFQVSDGKGVSIQVASGSDWHEHGQVPCTVERRMSKEGYPVVERCRVIHGVKVYELERE